VDVKCIYCKHIWNVSVKNKDLKRGKYTCPDCTSSEREVEERYPIPSRKFRKNK